MDPHSNIQQQRAAAAAILSAADTATTPPEHLEALAVELATLAQALDDWRRSGGFDPYTAATTPTTGTRRADDTTVTVYTLTVTHRPPGVGAHPEPTEDDIERAVLDSLAEYEIVTVTARERTP